uniref:Uncharacterized protein n=1 Tax=Rhipicephalus zambeziensis TaxID=60191 RepID=A0A224YFV8_9ACAR
MRHKTRNVTGGYGLIRELFPRTEKDKSRCVKICISDVFCMMICDHFKPPCYSEFVLLRTKVTPLLLEVRMCHKHILSYRASEICYSDALPCGANSDTGNSNET